MIRKDLLPTETRIDRLRASKQIVGSWGQTNPVRLRYADQRAGQIVLDMGCAGGQYVQALGNTGREIYGCDLLVDTNWIMEINQYFCNADALALPYPDEQFDTIIAFEVLEHVPSVDRAVRELHRICKRNIMISVPNCESLPIFQASGLTYHHWVDRTHVQAFTRQSLTELLHNQGFEITDMRLINPIKPELLALNAWHISNRVASVAARAANRLPIRRKYNMTIIANAVKRGP